jgi:replicative DNA helicase
MPDNLQTNKSISIAELRILNCSFHHPETFDSIDHSVMIHGIASSLMKAMERMRSAGTEFTKMSLLQEASRIDLDVDEGFIEDVIADTGETKVDDAVAILKRGRQNLETMKLLDKIKDLIDTSPIGDEDRESEIRTMIDEASMNFSMSSDDVQKVYTTEEWMQAWDEEWAKRRMGRQYPFNNFIFDSLIPDGAVPGTFGCIAAASGSGKSTVGLKLMRSLISSEVPCMMFSLEMALIPTADRMLSADLQIPYSAITNPSESGEYESITKRVQAVRDEYDAHKRFRICENANLTLNDIARHIMKFQADIGQRYCVVIIDLLSMVKEFASSRGNMNYADTVTEATNLLSAMTKVLGVHVVGIVQLNRSAENDKVIRTWDDCESFRPQRSQIKSAGAYVERSRYVLGIHRPMFWAINAKIPEVELTNQQDWCYVTVLKINNGETGVEVKAIFDGEVFDILPITKGAKDDDEPATPDEP